VISASEMYESARKWGMRNGQKRTPLVKSIMTDSIGPKQGSWQDKGPKRVSVSGTGTRLMDVENV